MSFYRSLVNKDKNRRKKTPFFGRALVRIRTESTLFGRAFVRIRAKIEKKTFVAWLWLENKGKKKRKKPPFLVGLY